MKKILMWVTFQDNGSISMEPAEVNEYDTTKKVDIKNMKLEACGSRIRQLVKICIYYLENRNLGEEEEIFAKAVKAVAIQEGGITLSTVYDKIRQCDSTSTEFFRNLVESFYKKEGNELIDFLKTYRGRNNKSADLDAINMLDDYYS